MSKQAKDSERRSVGRPTSYRPDYCQIAFSMALLGATDEQLADALGVTERTVNAWKIEHPEFFQSIKGGKIQADARVANSLYARALGYEHDDVDIRTVSIGNGMSEIVKTPIRKYYPPETAACIFWLKNRQRNMWRDKQESETDESVAHALKDLADKLPG